MVAAPHFVQVFIYFDFVASHHLTQSPPPPAPHHSPKLRILYPPVELVSLSGITLPVLLSGRLS